MQKTAPLTYMEALLLEEISRSRAEALLHKTPAAYYVNDRLADDSIMPFIERLLDAGCLNSESPASGVFYYTINDKGTDALTQTLSLSHNPC